MRWLTTIFLALFAFGLLGCASAELAKASRPMHPQAVFHSGGGRDVPAADRSPMELGSDDHEEAEKDVTVASPAAKEQPVTKAADPQPTAPKNPPGPSFGAQAPHVADLIIYTATITMAVYQVEPGLDAVERIARETGGYLAQRSDKQITIRVPRARFDDAHVDRDFCAAADAQEGLVDQHAQDLVLRLARQIGDIVDE